MGSIYDWSTTASDNGASDATVNFAEGQTPASLNNSARAVMARVAAWLKGLGAAITHGGSSNAYTLTLPTGHTITAYATGMRFLWKPNGNSSGSVTLNVDGVGAKKVYLPSGSQAGSGHITSGTLIDVVYDATLDSAAGGFQIVGSSSAIASQPLDATLTALAALSWSSGNALIQMTAADTVSLTLTPSVTSVTASNGSAAATAAGTFVNTTDNSQNVALDIQSDRATPAANDRVMLNMRMSDSAGNQDIFGRIIVQGLSVTSTSESAAFYLALMSSGTLTERYFISNTLFAPVTNDQIALGSTTLGWADLHLATGGVINWNNGDVTVTHSSNALAFAGASSGYSFDAGVSVSQGAAATTPSGIFTNTTDNGTVEALRIQGDRATPTAFDQVYASWFLSDSAGNQDEMWRISAQGTTLTSGSETARALLSLRISGALTSLFFFNSNSITPATNDLLALGSTSLGFSDIHVASGAVYNVANGLVTLTHDATNDRLVLAGGALKARPAISTDTGGTLTSASDNCIVDLATAPTINDGVHEAGSIIVLVNNTASSMTITQDTGMTLRLHGTSTTGNRTLAARGIATIQIDPASNAEAICMGDVS